MPEEIEIKCERCGKPTRVWTSSSPLCPDCKRDNFIGLIQPEVTPLQDTPSLPKQEGEKEPTLGAILKEARIKLGLKFSDVLEETGVSVVYLDRLETDDLKTISAGVLWKLATLYKLDLKALAIKAGIIIKKPPSPPAQEPDGPVAGIPYGMEVKPWDSIRLIGEPRKRFEELIEKGFDWHSFYHAWLEGRAEMLKEVLLDNSAIREHANARIKELEAKCKDLQDWRDSHL
jgi:transcriptional regulator with XRE-family HTH domain